jgi:hypothetical protein
MAQAIRVALTWRVPQAYEADEVLDTARAYVRYVETSAIGRRQTYAVRFLKELLEDARVVEVK